MCQMFRNELILFVTILAALLIMALACKKSRSYEKSRTHRYFQHSSISQFRPLTLYRRLVFDVLRREVPVPCSYTSVSGVVAVLVKNTQIGRTHRSVEFKHQNISAVLDELGMPWIPGYKPRRNYQNAIFDAIDRYLTKHPAILEPVPASPPPVTHLPAEIFVAPPVLRPSDGPIPEPLRRLVRKFDPVERDHRNRSLGKAGEEFVVDVERRKLTRASRPDLARKVRWIAAEDGDGAGYDVLSFDLVGRERLLEVKTTNGSARTPFFLTRNERELATERPADWSIYRVHLFA
jgi:hypothetical protein